MNTLLSASKYFVTSLKIREQPCPPDVPNRQNKGVPASSVELKGDERHRDGNLFFLPHSLPLCPVQCVTDASSLCVPPALPEMTLIGNRAWLEFDALLVKSAATAYMLQIKTELELIAITSIHISLLEVL